MTPAWAGARWLRSAPRATAVLLAGSALPGPSTQDPATILGRWRGTSTCVVAAWNSACNDEQIVYEFVPGTDTGRVLLHAAKLMAGQPEPMYDLEFSYSTTTATWDGDFANARVSIRWSYSIRHDTLLGTVVMLSTRQVGRHVVAWRDAGGNPSR